MVVSVGEVNTIAKRKGRDRKCWEKYIIKQEGRQGSRKYFLDAILNL